MVAYVAEFSRNEVDDVVLGRAAATVNHRVSRQLQRPGGVPDVERCALQQLGRHQTREREATGVLAALVQPREHVAGLGAFRWSVAEDAA